MVKAIYDAETNIVRLAALTLGPRGAQDGVSLAGALNTLVEWLAVGAPVKVQLLAVTRSTITALSLTHAAGYRIEEFEHAITDTHPDAILLGADAMMRFKDLMVEASSFISPLLSPYESLITGYRAVIDGVSREIPVWASSDCEPNEIRFVTWR